VSVEGEPSDDALRHAIQAVGYAINAVRDMIDPIGQ
jgi:hypothetical protein